MQTDLVGRVKKRLPPKRNNRLCQQQQPSISGEMFLYFAGGELCPQIWSFTRPLQKTFGPF